jgi:DNA ligase (NAD+)
MNTKRIQELETLITKHNSLYWEDNSPEISDPDYDALFEELKLLDPTNILVTKVNKEFVWGTEVKHDKPMLSLDKVYNNDDLIK